MVTCDAAPFSRCSCCSAAVQVVRPRIASALLPCVIHILILTYFDTVLSISLLDQVLEMLNSLEGAPVMVVELSTYDAMSKIHNYTPKLNIHDNHRVGVAIDHYEPYIDFDELMRRTQAGNSSFNDPGSISFADLTRRL